MIAFKTAWEWQVGRLWGRVLFPRFWRTSPTRIVMFGWETSK